MASAKDSSLRHPCAQSVDEMSDSPAFQRHLEILKRCSYSEFQLLQEMWAFFEEETAELPRRDQLLDVFCDGAKNTQEYRESLIRKRRDWARDIEQNRKTKQEKAKKRKLELVEKRKLAQKKVLDAARAKQLQQRNQTKRLVDEKSRQERKEKIRLEWAKKEKMARSTSRLAHIPQSVHSAPPSVPTSPRVPALSTLKSPATNVFLGAQPSNKPKCNNELRGGLCAGDWKCGVCKRNNKRTMLRCQHLSGISISSPQCTADRDNASKGHTFNPAGGFYPKRVTPASHQHDWQCECGCWNRWLLLSCRKCNRSEDYKIGVDDDDELLVCEPPANRSIRRH